MEQMIDTSYINSSESHCLTASVPDPLSLAGGQWDRLAEANFIGWMVGGYQYNRLSVQSIVLFVTPHCHSFTVHLSFVGAA